MPNAQKKKLDLASVKEAKADKDAKELKSELDEAKSSKLEFEGTLSREEAIAYFEAIVSGLKKGSVRFRRAEQALELTPGAHIDVEVKVSQKARKNKISFELSWSVLSEQELEIS